MSYAWTQASAHQAVSSMYSFSKFDALCLSKAPEIAYEYWVSPVVCW